MAPCGGLKGRAGFGKLAARWRPVPPDEDVKDRTTAPIERSIAHIDAWGPEASMPECNLGRLAGLAGWLGWLGTQAWLARMAWLNSHTLDALKRSAADAEPINFSTKCYEI